MVPEVGGSNPLGHPTSSRVTIASRLDEVDDARHVRVASIAVTTSCTRPPSTSTPVDVDVESARRSTLRRSDVVVRAHQQRERVVQHERARRRSASRRAVATHDLHRATSASSPGIAARRRSWSSGPTAIATVTSSGTTTAPPSAKTAAAAAGSDPTLCSTRRTSPRCRTGTTTPPMRVKGTAGRASRSARHVGRAGRSRAGPRGGRPGTRPASAPSGSWTGAST